MSSLSHILPTELLSKVFAHYVFEREDGVRRADYFADLYRLMAVCRAWASIIINDCAYFWPVVRGTEPMKVVERALGCSKGLPLDVIWPGRFRELRVRPTLRFWDVVGKHIHRWRTLQIHLRQPQELRALLERGVLESGKAAMLRKLKVYSPSEDPPVAVDLLRGQAPALDDITLENIVLRDWSSPIFSGLRSLSLITIRSGTTPTVQQIIVVLERCHDLRTLKLSDVRFTHGPSPLANAIINLNLLHQCSLTELTSSDIVQILGAARMPQCSLFDCSLREEDEEESRRGLDAFAVHVSPSLERHLQTAHCVDLRIRWEEDAGYYATQMEILDEEYATNFKFTTENIFPQDITEWLLNGPLKVMAFDGTFRLELHQHVDLDGPALVSILHRIPAITQLELAGLPGSAYEAILVELMIPEVVDGQPRWLCPRLSELEIRCWFALDPSLVLRMARSRVEGLPSLDQSGTSVCKGPFRTLVIEGSWMDVGTFRELVQVLGRDVVQWAWEPTSATLSENFEEEQGQV